MADINEHFETWLERDSSIYDYEEEHLVYLRQVFESDDQIAYHAYCHFMETLGQCDGDLSYFPTYVEFLKDHSDPSWYNPAHIENILSDTCPKDSLLVSLEIGAISHAKFFEEMIRYGEGNDTQIPI